MFYSQLVFMKDNDARRSVPYSEGCLISQYTIVKTVDTTKMRLSKIIYWKSYKVEYC